MVTGTTRRFPRPCRRTRVLGASSLRLMDEEAGSRHAPRHPVLPACVWSTEPIMTHMHHYSLLSSETETNQKKTRPEQVFNKYLLIINYFQPRHGSEWFRGYQTRILFGKHKATWNLHKGALSATPVFQFVIRDEMKRCAMQRFLLCAYLGRSFIHLNNKYPFFLQQYYSDFNLN